MRLTGTGIVEPFRFEEVKRPWGHYGQYSHNEVCTSKILFIKRDQMLSMQYHFRRDQFYLLLDNDFIIEYSNKPVPQNIIEIVDDDARSRALEYFLKDNLVSIIAHEGEMFGFHKLVVHRAVYIGTKPQGRILDIAFGDNDEEDIVRIKDKYGRAPVAQLD